MHSKDIRWKGKSEQREDVEEQRVPKERGSQIWSKSGQMGLISLVAVRSGWRLRPYSKSRVSTHPTFGAHRLVNAAAFAVPTCVVATNGRLPALYSGWLLSVRVKLEESESGECVGHWALANVDGCVRSEPFASPSFDDAAHGGCMVVSRNVLSDYARFSPSALRATRQ